MPCIIATAFVAHRLVAMTVTTLFLSQMAVLEVSMRTWPGKYGTEGNGIEETYMRITIKSEAEIMLI